MEAATQTDYTELKVDLARLELKSEDISTRLEKVEGHVDGIRTDITEIKAIAKFLKPALTIIGIIVLAALGKNLPIETILKLIGAASGAPE